MASQLVLQPSFPPTQLPDWDPPSPLSQRVGSRVFPPRPPLGPQHFLQSSWLEPSPKADPRTVVTRLLHLWEISKIRKMYQSFQKMGSLKLMELALVLTLGLYLVCFPLQIKEKSNSTGVNQKNGLKISLNTET